MAFQESSGWCEECEGLVLVRRPGTNHVLHLLLSVITLGWWLPIWLLSAVKIGGWRCSQCGCLVNEARDFWVMVLSALVIVAVAVAYLATRQ